MAILDPNLYTRIKVQEVEHGLHVDQGLSDVAVDRAEEV